MYQKAKNSWIKHIDFVILDILCLQVSFFFLAYLVRHRNLNLYSNSVYGNLSIVLILIDVCMMFFLNTCKNVLKRGLLIELAATMRQVSLVILFAVFYLFFVKDAGDFSRITLFLTAIFLCYNQLWDKNSLETACIAESAAWKKEFYRDIDRLGQSSTGAGRYPTSQL